MARNLSQFSYRVLSACCLLAATAYSIGAQPLTFTTLAGKPGGAGSADGAGNAARFNKPTGVAVDSGGTIYVADSSNSTIRKITSTGVVTTFAGSADGRGVSDGAGGTARFAIPTGLAIDGDGNVYVADTGNYVIRKITPAGVVTTLAGSFVGSADGTGKAARFNHPNGVATDSGGNVYVSDSYNHTIRKITRAGVVTTLAGSAGVMGSADGTGSAARFAFPNGVATDKAGNVYVADGGNNRTVRKITPDGVVTTLAGLAGKIGGIDGTGSAARFNFTQGIATDGIGNIYVSDAGTIRKVTPAGVVTTLAGSPNLIGSTDGTGSAARFNNSSGLAADSDGNVYVADTVNHTIRKITPSGVVTTLAGLAVVVDGADGAGSAAGFNFPAGLATDGDGNVYVADSSNNTIRKITPAGMVTTVAGMAGVIGSTDGTGSAARFSHPEGIATDAGGNVYVCDATNKTIRKITPAGVVTTFAGHAGTSGSTDGEGVAASFSLPRGIATDGTGNVYVVDYFGSTIRKITPAGVVTTLAGSPGQIGSADGTGSASRFRSPTGVAIDRSDNIYVVDQANSTIRRITSAGVVTTLAGSAGVSGSTDGTVTVARFHYPWSVTTDSAGNVYVGDHGNRTIRKISTAGVLTTVAGLTGIWGGADGTGSAARLDGAMALATDGSGNLYAADTGNHRILVGRPALADVATIDSSVGTVSMTRQLDTSPQTAKTWQWRIIRQPSGSTNTLSSTSIRNPVFTPDAPDRYVFQLTASDGVRTSITVVELTAAPAKPGPRRRPARSTP